MQNTVTENDEDEVVLSIHGMSCSACATRIERSLHKLEGVEDVAVSYPLRTAWIKGGKSRLDPNKLIAKIIALGFQAHLYTSSIEEMKREKKRLGKRLILSCLLSFPLVATMLQHIPPLQPLLQFLPGCLLAPWLQLLLATAIQFFVGLPFYISAYHAIREKLANMDVLVVLGTSAAYLYSHYEVFLNGLEGLIHYAGFQHPQLYFESSAVVITVVLLGKYIELSAALSLQEQHEPFAKFQVKEVMVERKGLLQQLHVAYVNVNDIVHHQEGDIIAIDGTIISGEANIDEALLTGEQSLSYKSVGEKVWAGTLLVQGGLRIQAETAGRDTMLQKIRELVKQGQTSKTMLQRQVDTVMRWFVPAIVVLALITGALWLASGESLSVAMLSTLAVLLVACPCALGLAAPISLAIASSRLVKHGVIVKEASVIERLSKVKEMVFDKTGTLTEGKLSVSVVHSFYKSKAAIIAIAAALEQYAKHPIAEAIINAARSQDEEHSIIVTNGEHKLGYGVIGDIGSQRYLLGNERMLEHEGKALPPYVTALAEERLQLGDTLLYMFEGNRCIGLIGLSDQIKASSAAAMNALKAMSIKLSIATGDHAGSASRVAKETGIEQHYSNLLPAQKLSLVEQKQQGNGVVAMVGDGWNDAPALARAGVGIAMSHSTDAALHAGHMTLLHSQLTSIPLSIVMSRMTVRNIKQNLTFALVYNAMMIPVAALGYLQPWMAGVAMSLSSLCVVFNALALHRRLKKSEGVLSTHE